MYYYKVNDSLIEKYSVLYDEEKLHNLRKEIITCSSLIEHIDKRVTSQERVDLYNAKYSDKEIRNFQERYIRLSDNGPQSTIFKVSYDLYHYPNLVLLIDRLILGDASAIDEIYNYNDVDVYKTLEDKLKDINIKQNKAIRFAKKAQLFFELKRVEEQCKLNSKQVSPMVYKEELLSILDINYIGYIDSERLSLIRRK